MYKKLISVAVIISMLFVYLPVLAEQQIAPDTVYNFGSQDVAGTITVPAELEYSADTGYGFLGLSDGYLLDSRIDGWVMTQGYDLVLENGSNDTAGDVSDSWVATTKNESTSIISPIRFAVKAETNSYYRVRINLRRADLLKEANVNLFTEKRHQQLVNEPIPAEGISYVCTVHVHNNWSKNTGEYVDNMLNIVAEGENVAITSVGVEKLDTGKTLWVLGDSTVCQQTASIPYFPLDHCQGIASAMPKYLGSQWSLVNEAESGLASRDARNHFNNFINDVLPGDIVWFEFGHNDDKITTDPETNGYLSNLEYYYSSVTEAGASFIVVSPVTRCTSGNFSSGEWTPSLTQYADAAKNFVEEKISQGADNIAYIDLNTPSAEFLTSEYTRMVNSGYDYSSNAARFYYYVSKSYQSDYTHPNDYGADNFAAIVMDEAKDIVTAADGYVLTVQDDTDAVRIDAFYDSQGALTNVTDSTIMLQSGENIIPKEDGSKTFVWESYETMKPYTLGYATESVKAQAEVLRPFIQGSKDKDGELVSEEIFSAGKAPNKFYPDPLVEVVKYPYPIILEDITFNENNSPETVSGRWVASDLQCVYAYVKFDIYTSSGELKASVMSDNFFDYSGTENQTLTFTTSEVYDSSMGDTFKVYAVEYIDDGTLTDTVVSTTLTEDSLIDIKDTLISDDFSSYGITGVILGTNGWSSAGTGEFNLTEDSAAEFVSTDITKTWYVYNNFTAVSSGQLMVKFDLRYTSGTMSLYLTDGSKAPNNWPPSLYPLKVYTNNGEVKVALDGTDVCSINKGEMTTIKLIVDIDYGKYYLTVAGATYTQDIPQFDTTEQPVPEKLGCLAFIANRHDAEYTLDNITVATLNTPQLPEYELSLLANDSNYGTVLGSGTYPMNATVTIKAVPNDGYVFVGWFDENDSLFSEADEYSFRLRNTVVLTAKFMKQSGLSGVVDYEIATEKGGLRAEAGKTLQLNIANPVDENNNPVSGIENTDAQWSCDEPGITISQSGLVTVDGYTLPENSIDSINVTCVLNGIEKTVSVTVYSYAFYEKVSEFTNYDGRIVNYGGSDAMIFGGDDPSVDVTNLYKMGDTVALDGSVTLSYKHAWSGPDTASQRRTLNFKDEDGNTVFSLYYVWGGLFVGSTELPDAVSEDVWSDVVIKFDTDTKTVTVTSGSNSAQMSYTGDNIAAIEFVAKKVAPAERYLGISEIIIKK